MTGQLNQWKNDSVTPYVGVGIGSYKYNDTAQYYLDNEDLRGVAINLNAGLLFQTTKNLELELAYKYKSIQWQDTMLYVGIIPATIELEEKLVAFILVQTISSKTK